tara:strand:+ start:2015 stop:4096 length:2082 start_codon:yes stop_codon:yes gene_type:complete
MKKRQTYGVRLEVENGKAVKAELVDVGEKGEKSLDKIGKAGIEGARGLDIMRGAVGRLGGAAKFLTGLRGAIVGLAGAAGFAAATKQSLDFASSLQDLSQTANINVEDFQELRFAALQVGIETETAADGFKEMSLRADEFVQTGAGPAKEAYDRLGLSQKEVSKLMKDGANLFEVIIQRMKETGDAAANIRIADELFGGSAGEQFVRLLDDSATSLSVLREEARAMGVVLSEETVRGADAANDRLRVLSEVLKVNLANALAQNSERILEFTSRIIEHVPAAIEGIEDLAEAFGLLAAAPTIENLNKINQEIEEIQSKIEKGPGLGDRLWTAFWTPNPSKWSEQVLSDDNTIGQAQLREQLADLQAQRKEIEEALSKQNAAQERSAMGAEKEAGAQQVSAEAKRENASAARILSTEMRENLEVNNTYIEALEFEIELLGKSSREQAMLRAERRLSADATAEQRDRVRELAGELYDQREELKRAEKNSKDMTKAQKEMGKVISDDLGSVLRTSGDDFEAWGARAVDVITDVILHLLELNSTSSGSGGGGFDFAGVIADGISGLFGGGLGSGFDPAVSAPPVKPSFSGRATGGPMAAGRAYRFRELEDEVFVPNVNGTAVPVSQMGGGAEVVNNIIINNASRAEVSQQGEQDNSSGGKDIELIIQEIGAKGMNTPGNPMYNALNRGARANSHLSRG